MITIILTIACPASHARVEEVGAAERAGVDVAARSARGPHRLTANLRTKILDFRGLDSSRTLMLRGGILMSTGNVLESLSYSGLAEYC